MPAVCNIPTEDRELYSQLMIINKIWSRSAVTGQGSERTFHSVEFADLLTACFPSSLTKH